MRSETNDELAELCLDWAREEALDDRSRWLLEHAAKRINSLGQRGLRLAVKLELAEMREQQWQRIFTDSQLEAISRECSLRGRLSAALHAGLDAARVQFCRLLGH